MRQEERLEIAEMYKDLVLSQLNHENTNRIPYGKLFFEDELEEKITMQYGSERWKEQINNALLLSGGLSSIEPKSKKFSGEFKDIYGTVWMYRDGIPHIAKPIIEKPDSRTLASLKFPSIEQLVPDSYLRKVEKDRRDNSDKFIIAETLHGVWERVWALCGLESALIYSAIEKDFFMDLLSLVTEHEIDIINRYNTTNADAIMFADDWGDQRSVLLGPVSWRELIKPHLRSMTEAVHSSGKFAFSHCCGHFTEIIPDIIEAGLDCIQSVQPKTMDLDEIKHLGGDQLTFWGGIGTQELMPFGSPEQIELFVTDLVIKYSSKGGWILGPSKKLTSEVPVENALMLIDVLNKAEKGELL